MKPNINKVKRNLYLAVGALATLVPMIPQIQAGLRVMGAPAWLITIVGVLGTVYGAFNTNPHAGAPPAVPPAGAGTLNAKDDSTQ